MPNRNKSGKIPVLSAIIGALCIILYIGALSYGALNIYNNITERRALGDREFDGLADLASAAGVLGFMDEKFIQTIQDAIDSSETILGVVISGSKGEFAFEKERGTVISWVNNSPRFVPRFAVTRPPKYLPLRIEGQRNVNIQAVSGYLDYDFCIEILKRTLLIVLFSLTLAFFTLLMDALLTKNMAGSGAKAAVSPQGAADNSPGGPPGSSANGPPGGSAPGPAVVHSPAGEKEAPGTAPAPGKEPEKTGTAEEEVPGEEQTDWNTENFDFEDEDDFPYLEDEEIPEETGTAAAESPASGPQGLFSPRGNVGWESYTRERLESELHRSASTEQDLTVIVMAFKEPEKLSENQFRCFADEAALFFEHRDLIFEYGERGLWIIHPNHNLEQDLAAAEEFNNRIIAKLPRPEFSKIDLRFGISSRSGRLIDAERIMLEAREALKRAAEDNASH
ncbi:MAG: hypothetical protein LBG07_09385, partial [Treponema sp.]|nr:hypothetical protein [Treponema sp.]